MGLVPVLVFSDFTCPFSRVTEAAVRRLEDEGTVAVLGYRAHELHPPGTPLPAPRPEDVEAVRALAEELGVEVRVPPLVPRTRKAHELIRLAGGRGVPPPAVREAIFDAYFRDGLDIGRIDVLVRLGEGLGLDASETKVILDVDTFAGMVEAERGEAARRGVPGTPTLLFGAGPDAVMMVGAHPLAELRRQVAELAPAWD